MIRTRRSAKRRDREERLARVRLLSAELSELRVASVERTRSLDAKASFLVIAAGVLGTSIGLGVLSPEIIALSLTPLSLVAGTLLCATVALWPRATKLPSGREVVNRWVEAKMTAAELEDHLLEVKAEEVANRDKGNQLKARYVKFGFVLLVISIYVVMVAIAFDAALRR